MRKNNNINIFKQIEHFQSKAEYIDYLKKETQIFCSQMDNLSRPEHVACVYLLGKNLFIKLYGERLIETPDGLFINFQIIWKYLSIFHDIGYGYQNHNIFEDEFNPNKLRELYLGYVLDSDDKVNNHWAVSFNVNELIAYYYYIFQKRTNENLLEHKNIFETHEHGILGGAIASRIMESNTPSIYKSRSNTWYYIRLVCALGIAQHNIWPITQKDIKNITIYLKATG